MKRRCFKYLLFSVKENFLSLVFILFTISLVLFSRSNLGAAKNGLLLWANSVIPSLFPFFVATELLSYTNTITLLGSFFNPLMRPLFNVPGIGAFPFIMGIISGYPTGAKIVSNFKDNGLCSDIEAERLIAFTNNSGPLFIIGTVGISLFGNSQIGFLLFFTHILSCITVGIIFRFWKYKQAYSKTSNSSILSQNKTTNISSLGKILGESIKNATSTILLIGGFVVFFSVIISILNNSGLLSILCSFINPIFKIMHINSEFSSGFICGIIELTNGINIIANINEKAISLNIIVCSFLLGFGGFSVVLQVWGIISNSNISIKPYIIGKLLQGILSAFYTYFFVNNFTIFNLNLP